MLIFVKRFYVFEPLTLISINVNRPIGKYSGTGQEVDFKVTCNLPDLRDPTSEIRAVLMQNFRTDNAKILNPLFYNDNVLD